MNPDTAGGGGWKSGIRLAQRKTLVWINTLNPSVNWKLESVLQNQSSQSSMAEAAVTGLLPFGLSIGLEIISPELCTVLYS